MKLDPEGVEKAAEVANIWREDAVAALTVYFSHLKESGKMRDGELVKDVFGDEVAIINILNQKNCIIIRTEKE